MVQNLLFTEDDMRAAVDFVLNQGMGLRKAAQAQIVNYGTLSRCDWTN